MASKECENKLIIGCKTCCKRLDCREKVKCWSGLLHTLWSPFDNSHKEKKSGSTNQTN
jgi:hypothetical protein